MRGHAEHDDMKYVPAALLEEWKAKDPLARYQKHLIDNGLAAEWDLAAIDAMIEKQLDADVAFAEASPFPDPDSALLDVYGDRSVADPTPPLVREAPGRKA
jgi:TPP-dependent pyruvate/acetoin dehydrogenase alpha subunit